MRLASIEDKNLVVDIIRETFQDNPHFNFILRKRNRARSIETLAEYLFNYGYEKGGVHISSDNMGVAIIFKQNLKVAWLKQIMNTIRLLLWSFDLWKLPQIIRHENRIKSKRPSSGEYLYFWIFCVKKEGRARRAPREVRDYIFEESLRTQLPVYAEATLERNKLLLEKFGFSVYDYMENRVNNVKVWFLKRNADNIKNNESFSYRSKRITGEQCCA